MGDRLASTYLFRPMYEQFKEHLPQERWEYLELLCVRGIGGQYSETPQCHLRPRGMASQGDNMSQCNTSSIPPRFPTRSSNYPFTDHYRRQPFTFTFIHQV
jgi:hypothetical protein